MTKKKRKDDTAPTSWAPIKTEFKAVCALESYLLKSDLLLPLINRNDRNISWDGEIKIFSTSR